MAELILGVFGFFLAIGPAGQAGGLQEFISLEQRLSEALVRLDVHTLDELWSDDLVFVSPDGKVSTKQERLAGIRASTASPDAAVATAAVNDDVKVRLYERSHDIAIVTLISTWKGKSNDREYTRRYTTTHVWARQGRQWRLVSAHVSMYAQ